jgi:hypothetical protein
MVQSCPEASPMKWYQAHTTWFSETLVLRPLFPDYKSFCEDFRWLLSIRTSVGSFSPQVARRIVCNLRAQTCLRMRRFR